MSDCEYSESYLNGLTNNLDDYLYTNSNTNDEIENLSGENHTGENPSGENLTQENPTQENPTGENTTEVNLSNFTLDQKIEILFSKMEFVTSKIRLGKKVVESDLEISKGYPHCLINTTDDENEQNPNNFINFILNKPDFTNKTETLRERLSKI